MKMWLDLLLLVIGFVLLLKGADVFVDGSAGVARIFKVPGVIIGLTIVAMGTSAPELAVSVLVHGGGIPHWKIGLNMFQIFSQLDHTTHSAAPVIDRAARPKNSLLQGM